MKTKKIILAASLITMLAATTPASAGLNDTIKTSFTAFGNWFNNNREIRYGIGAAAVLGVALYYWMRPAKQQKTVAPKITTTIECAGTCNARTEHTVTTGNSLFGTFAVCNTNGCKRMQNVRKCAQCGKHTPYTTSGECTECTREKNAPAQAKVKTANNAQNIQVEEFCKTCNEKTWHRNEQCTKCNPDNQ